MIGVNQGCLMDGELGWFSRSPLPGLLMEVEISKQQKKRSNAPGIPNTPIIDPECWSELSWSELVAGWTPQKMIMTGEGFSWARLVP